ncbi:type II secretion system secretin GspD [Geminicoccaceae bacterium 1502E]|nr:type II secretion system secretin GspD [Geminicoccaceae bacterium 1502E]
MTRQAARLFRAVTVMLTTLLAAACADTRGPSQVTQTIDGLDFSVPRQQGAAPLATGTQGAGQPPLRAEIFSVPGRTGRATAGVGVQRTGEGVQINLDGAEISEAARVILGDILHQPFSIDPQVIGEVTLSTSGGVSERDLVMILETALRMNGAALVQTPSGWLVTLAEEATGRSDIQPLGGRALQVQPGLGATIVPLQNISATTAAQFIQPLVHRPEDIRIDQTRNLIMFAGTGAERQNVLDTLNALDVSWLAGRSVGIFPLQQATAESLVPELEALFSTLPAAEGEAVRGGGVQFMPVARLNAVLAIGSSAEEMAQVEQWVARLDRGRLAGPQFFVYELKHASAEDIAKILTESFGEAGAGAFEEGPSPVLPVGLAPQPLAPDGGPPTGASVLEGQNGGGFAPAVASGPVRIVANESNNSLLIRATPQTYEMIEGTLRRLDTAPLQVLIEATIAEVSLNDLLRYGVQYFIEAGNTSFGYNTTVGGEGGGVIDRANLSPLSRVPGFNFIFTGGNANITIDALSQLTDVKVLSSPSVVVQDNSEAVLTVGDEVPITTRTAVSVEDPTAPTVNNIEYRDTGVILQVKPRINSNQVVSLDIAQEVSRVVGTTATGPSPTPTIQQRKITSKVNVASGQTVVLGGLIQDAEERGRDRIPVLGDIPVLGHLFGSTRNDQRRTELIVFITPRVIRNAEDARDISEELRQRMRSLRSRQAPVWSEPVPAAITPAPAPPQGPRPLAPRPTAGPVEPAAPAREPLPQGGRDLAAREPARLPTARPAANDPVAPRARPVLVAQGR